ncbi:PP2C family serine/threonine-protein phosphatase [Acinetobacter sp.]|uniref:PP2C family protein-serine/threonine phosphatase n=1 Tax=Acinetobacter sp. TaxID=472 RepID=UPI0035B3B883
MNQQYFEMQALTWRATPPIQQDAILIGHSVIQHDGLISKRYIYPASEDWCAAVSDGVNSSPKAEKASKSVLKSVLAQFQAKQRISLQQVQEDLSTHLAANPKTYSASATLALVSHASPQGFVNIQHVGDSRVYLFNGQNQQWYALTKDHNFLNEMVENREIEIIVGQEYASFYYMLNHCFCADSLHEIPEFPPKEEYLTDEDALLICSDGVHDILECSNWLPLCAEVPLKTWLMEMKTALHQKYAYDNVSMILIRLKRGHHNES